MRAHDPSGGDEKAGRDLLELVDRLLPLPRSLTGDGVRATLGVLAETLPLTVVEVPSGTRVLDWTVPDEWRVHGARITGPDGRVLVDWADSALHLVGHSVPFRGRLSLTDLLPHLHTLPDQPALTPYRTSYYTPTWGFCLPHDRVAELAAGEYDVLVDTELFPGHLSYGELLLPGAEQDEVLITAHICHPAQANDNLSGIAVAAALAERLLHTDDRRLTYRFLFAPGTLGAIAWLAGHHDEVGRIRAGLVLTGLGDRSPATYKRSRRSCALVDRAVTHVLSHDEPGARVLPFSPYGYDERQFCSPGYDLPVGRLGRAVHGEYPEYHTSADDLSFVSAGMLAGSLRLLEQVVEVFERDRTYRSTAPYGEPQLGRRGLYRSTGATAIGSADAEMARLWVLNLADGGTGLLAMAERSELPFARLADAADQLVGVGLLTEVQP